MSTLMVGELVVWSFVLNNRIRCISYRNLKRSQAIKQNLLELFHHPHFIGLTLRMKLRITWILNTFFSLYQGQLLTNGVHLRLMYVSILTISVNISRNNKKRKLHFYLNYGSDNCFYYVYNRNLKWHKYFDVFSTVHHSIELFHLPTLMHNSSFINNMYVTLLSSTCFEH